MCTETPEYAACVAALTPDQLRHRASWLRWRKVLDRIITHRDYRFNGHPSHKAILLRLADFAQSMMAVHKRGL